METLHYPRDRRETRLPAPLDVVPGVGPPNTLQKPGTWLVA